VLKRPAIVFACLGFAAVFVFGLVRLFELRLAQGDVYPPYSTLRTDPLGASIFYESLERLPHFSSQRFFEQTFKETDGRGRSLFVLGTQPFGLTFISRTEFQAIQQFASKGGRVIVAFYPEVTQTWWTRRARTNEQELIEKDEESEKKDSSKTNNVTTTNLVSKTNANTNTASNTNSASTNNISKKESVNPFDPDDEERKQNRRHYVDLKKEWGFDVDYKDLEKDPNGKIVFPDATRVAQRDDLPQALSMHTALCFTNLHKGWSTIYQRGKKSPVVVERKFGDGAVLLVADSYPFSNEAMFKDRSASFLTYVLGGSHDAIFDEAHLGVAESAGIASLMRRYRLEGLICSLVLVAGLFVWKNSQSLVPPYEEIQTDAGPVVMGRDSSSGFINLVRRGVPPSKIIAVCFKEWTDSVGRTVFPPPHKLVEVERLIAEQKQVDGQRSSQVETYRRIAEILKRRK
jgi:hypothetical protein